MQLICHPKRALAVVWHGRIILLKFFSSIGVEGFRSDLEVFFCCRWSHRLNDKIHVILTPVPNILLVEIGLMPRFRRQNAFIAGDGVPISRATFSERRILM